MISVKHAIEQGDTALGVAGLNADNIFRRELREASDAVNGLLEAAMQAECSCSLKERDSGHRLECWMPNLKAAIAATVGNDG